MSVALDEFDPDDVNTLDERESHRCTARKRERPRFRRHLDVLRLECRDSVVDVQWTESEVVDGMAGTRRGLTLRCAEPGAAVVDPVNTIFQFTDNPAELIHVPRQRRIRIRSTQMNVVQPELCGVLHDFKASTEWVDHETELEQSGHFAS